MALLDARWWEINLDLSFKMEFGKGQLSSIVCFIISRVAADGPGPLKPKESNIALQCIFLKKEHLKLWKLFYIVILITL